MLVSCTTSFASALEDHSIVIPLVVLPRAQVRRSSPADEPKKRVSLEEETVRPEMIFAASLAWIPPQICTSNGGRAVGRRGDAVDRGEVGEERR